MGPVAAPHRGGKGRGRGRLPRRRVVREGVPRHLQVREGRAPAPPQAHRHAPARRRADRRDDARREGVPLDDRRGRARHVHRRARRRGRGAAAAARLPVDADGARGPGPRSVPAHQRARHGVRRDGRGRPHDQGREQHQGRQGDLPGAGRRSQPDARRCGHRMGEGRLADPPAHPSVPRGAVPLPRVRLARAARRAHRCHRAGVSRAARGPRDRLPRGLLPPERRVQGLRGRDARRRVRARDQVAQRRGRPLRLPPPRRRRVPAPAVQLDQEGGDDADPRARLQPLRRRHDGGLPCGDRADARAPCRSGGRRSTPRSTRPPRRGTELPLEGRQRGPRARHLGRAFAPPARVDGAPLPCDLRGPRRRGLARDRRALLARSLRGRRSPVDAPLDEEDQRARPRRVRQGRGDREEGARGAREGDGGAEGAPAPRTARRSPRRRGLPPRAHDAARAARRAHHAEGPARRRRARRRGARARDRFEVRRGEQGVRRLLPEGGRLQAAGRPARRGGDEDRVRRQGDGARSVRRGDRARPPGAHAARRDHELARGRRRHGADAHPRG